MPEWRHGWDDPWVETEAEIEERMARQDRYGEVRWEQYGEDEDERREEYSREDVPEPEPT